MLDINLEMNVGGILEQYFLANGAFTGHQGLVVGTGNDSAQYYNWLLDQPSLNTFLCLFSAQDNVISYFVVDYICILI